MYGCFVFNEFKKAGLWGQRLWDLNSDFTALIALMFLLLFWLSFFFFCLPLVFSKFFFFKLKCDQEKTKKEGTSVNIWTRVLSVDTRSVIRQTRSSWNRNKWEFWRNSQLGQELFPVLKHSVLFFHFSRRGCSLRDSSIIPCWLENVFIHRVLMSLVLPTLWSSLFSGPAAMLVLLIQKHCLQPRTLYPSVAEEVKQL